MLNHSYFRSPLERFLRLCCSAWTIISVGVMTALQANAQLDLTATSCTPGQSWDIPDQHGRVVSMWFNQGYLVINAAGDKYGYQKVYNLKNITTDGITGVNPINVARKDVGHHQSVGMGEVISQNWSGHTQLDLSKLPDIVEVTDTPNAIYITKDKIWEGIGGPGHRLVYYPYSFKNVPPAYQWVNRGSLQIFDETKTFNGGSPTNPLNYTPGPLSTIITTSKLGFEGRPAMIGNLLRICGDNEQPHGCATYDISDPANPGLLDFIRDGGPWGAITKQYDSMAQWRGFIVLAMNDHTGFIDAVDFIDMRDPTQLKHVARIYPEGSNLHRYAQFQDEFMYLGDKKYNMLPLEEGDPPEVVQDLNDVRTGSYLLPLGNLVVHGGLGAERGINSRVFCSQASPDTKPPYIGWHWPPENGVNNINMHTKSRIGLIINETLDLSTLNEDAFNISKSGDDKKLPVWVSHSDHDYINITPREPLEPNTTYQFKLVAGKLKDIAGNAAQEYNFTFSTGDDAQTNKLPHLDSLVIDNPTVGVNDKVSVKLKAHDPEGGRLEYYVSWGDGEVTRWKSDNTISHRYRAGGIYDVSLKVRNEYNLKDSTTFSVVVSDKTLAGTSSSSSIAMGPNRTVWNVNPDNDTVTISNADTQTKIAEVKVGNDPRGIAMDNHGNMWVTNYDEGSISIVSGREHRLLYTLNIHPGAQPYAVIMDSNNAYVSAQGSGALLKIDYSGVSTHDYSSLSSSNVSMLKGLTQAYAMAKKDNMLLVTRFISARDHGEVYKVDLTDFSLIKTIVLPKDKIIVETNNTGRGIVNYLTSISIKPDGSEAWVSSKHDNIFRGLGRDGVPRTHDTTTRSMINVIDLNTDTYLRDRSLHIDNQGLASAVLFSLNGELVYILHQGNNALSVFKTHTEQYQRIARVSFGAAPIGLTVDPKNNSVFVHSFLSREVYHYTAFAGTSGSLTAKLTPLGKPIETVSNETMSAPVLAGKRTFYNAANPKMSFEGYISCAGCHLDGGSDERVWDFHQVGEGFRNTIALQGRGNMLHGRVHWTANFDEIQDFEHDIRSPTFRGTGFMRDVDFEKSSPQLSFNRKSGKSVELDNMAAYLATLTKFPFSPHRNADGTLNTAVDIHGDGSAIGNGVKGKAIFIQLKCASCHGGNEFTDSPLGYRHDVGTIVRNTDKRMNEILTGIDTPTLRSLHDSAPYLHDGSADTLADVLDSAAHGHTDQLTSQERHDLIAYLLQIDSEEPAAGKNLNAFQIKNLKNFGVVSGRTLNLSVATSLPDITEVTWYVNGRVIASGNARREYNATYEFTDNKEIRLYAVATYNKGLNKMTSAELILKSSYHF